MGPHDAKDAPRISRLNQCRAAKGGEGTGARREATAHVIERLEAPPGFEPGMEVLQTSALPLGDGAPLTDHGPAEAGLYVLRLYVWKISGPDGPDNSARRDVGGALT